MSLKEGCDYLEKGITKLYDIVDGFPEPNFTPYHHIMLYTYVLINHMVFLGQIRFRQVYYLFFHLNCNSGPSTICVTEYLLTTMFLTTMLNNY